MKKLYHTYEEAHDRAMNRGALCDQCPYYGKRRGPVLSELRRDAKVFVLGSNPATDEVRSRQPLTGPTGQELETGLERGGLSRNDVSIANVVACQPSEPSGKVAKNLKISMAHLKRDLGAQYKSPIECCRPMVRRDLEDSGADTILVLGSEALDWIGKEYGIPVGKKGGKRKGRRLAPIADQSGHPFALPDGRTLCASMMPAFALASARHLIEPIRDDIAMAARVARLGVQYRDPEYRLFPTVDEIERWCRRAIRRGLPLMIDIETGDVPGINIRKDPIVYAKRAPLRCIGFGQWCEKPRPDADQETLRRATDIIVIPVRNFDGSRYWSKADGARVRAAIRSVLAALPLQAQNAAFDSAVLLAKKLIDDPLKPWQDTAVMHHNTREHDAPHNLAYISKRYMTIPLWKVDVEHSYVDENETEETDNG